MSAFVVQSYDDYQNHEIARIVEAMHRYIVLDLVNHMTNTPHHWNDKDEDNTKNDGLGNTTDDKKTDKNDEIFMNTVTVSAKYMYLTTQLVKNTKELQQITTFNRIASVRDPKKTLRKMLVSGDNQVYALFVRRYVLETAINKLRVSRGFGINYDDIPTL